MEFIKNPVAAFQFLTSIPIPLKTGMENLGKSLPFFPLVGAVIGLIMGAVHYGAMFLLPPEPALVTVILAYILLTRGLHLDGYMDTIDGFFSRKERGKVLEILKESTTGAFAILGAGIWFLFFYTTIPGLGIHHLVMIQGSSRFSVLLLPLLFSYPRESGTGKFFVEKGGAGVFLAGALFTLGFTLPFGLIYLVIPAVSLVTTFLTGLWSKKMIGGITGDTIGFAIEVNHMSLALLLVNKVLIVQ